MTFARDSAMTALILGFFRLLLVRLGTGLVVSRLCRPEHHVSSWWVAHSDHARAGSCVIRAACVHNST